MKIFKYLAKYWFIALLAPLCMMGEVAMDLTLPRLMSKIVDDGVLGGNMELIIQLGLRMLGLAFVGGVTGILSGVFTNIAAQNFSDDLRRDVYRHIMNLSFEQTDRFTTGSLITRLSNDVTMAQNSVAVILRMFVRSGFSFVGGIFMMVRLNLSFGVVIGILLPIQVLMIILFLKIVAPVFSKVQKKLDKVNSVVQENVSGARVVKAYVREEYENDRFSSANDDLMATNLRVMKLMATIMPLMMILMNLAVVAIIFIGGWQVRAQVMQVGSIMAAVNYITMISMSLMMVSMMFQGVSRAKASIDRITEVLSTEPALKDGIGAEGKQAGIISFQHVSFHYPNFKGRPVLNDISFDIRQGETVAILGATGAGKSTLVNLIPRFYDAVSGDVLVDGVNVKEYAIPALREKIGMVLQKSELFAGTVSDNIRWGNEKATEEEVIRAAKIAQADDFITGFNEGYETIISEKGASLSGGQKQRISIARAILKNPEILIFDDSTSALDLGTEARLRAALYQNLTDTTVIMIAQRVASVIHADKILVLENGAIVACGTHAQLLKSSPVYQDIYNSQMNKNGEVQ